MTYTQVYQKHYFYVLKICRSILKDRASSEDATQETFYKLLRHWDALEEKDDLSAWLRTTATNTCIDIIRKRSRELPFEEIRPTELPEEDPGKLLLEEAKDIVLTLAPKYQEIFHLSFICGYTGQQIADRLCIPLGTVKSRVRVCIQKIQAAL